MASWATAPSGGPDPAPDRLVGFLAASTDLPCADKYSALRHRQRAAAQRIERNEGVVAKEEVSMHRHFDDLRALGRCMMP